MAALGRVITEAICQHYGRDEFISRLSHPFWFQSFGAIMGMDWHSSGITTSVLGALKRGLAPVQGELGLYVCGGRGKHSLKTPTELLSVGERVGIDGDALARVSRLVAKVDSAAVQDGYSIYLHNFVVAADGNWVVVQQGMKTSDKSARRYHWLAEQARDFVDSPHSAVDGQPQGRIINLADRRARAARQAELELARDPDRTVDEYVKVTGRSGRAQLTLPNLQLPAHHEVRHSDVVVRRLRGALVAAANRGPVDFGDLLLTPGVGARTVAALAQVAEVVHGTPSRFSDPARFSYAHGGKDGHPFPVPLRVYDRTISVMRQAVHAAKLGNDDRLAAIKRLDREARRVESFASGPAWGELIEVERDRSAFYGGRTVSGPAKPVTKAKGRHGPSPAASPRRRSRN